MNLVAEADKQSFSLETLAANSFRHPWRADPNTLELPLPPNAYDHPSIRTLWDISAETFADTVDHSPVFSPNIEWPYRSTIEPHPEFIVPNPVVPNPGKHRYWIVAFNPSVPLDSQARRLRSLNGLRKLIMVVETAGSLEGWFLASPTDEQLDQWWAMALELGADPVHHDPKAQARYPWGRSNTGVLQRVIYFDFP
jgi:hypothetical protein